MYIFDSLMFDTVGHDPHIFENFLLLVYVESAIYTPHVSLGCFFSILRVTYGCMTQRNIQSSKRRNIRCKAAGEVKCGLCVICEMHERDG